MSDIAIKVENLSKRYRLGLKDELPDTLVAALSQAVKRPLRNWRRLQRLTSFRDNGRPADDKDSSSVVHRPSSGGVRTDIESDVIWALKDVSFEVERGEVVGIIGRNGAGKSTLLKILSQITVPTEGRAVINGRVGSLLEVGTGFHPELTGRENIYLNGAILGMTRAEIDRKFDEIVDFSGVEKFIDTPVKRYSSGMRVRLAFSVAAHLDPEILLIDEVLAVGDAAFQKKCLGKMEQVTGEGRTILFISHNMPSIQALCQQAIVLEEGRIVFSGQSSAAVENYLGKTRQTARSYVDLHSHAGRTPNSKPVFRSIRILDDQEEEAAVIQVGDKVIFEIELDANERLVKSPRIQIHVLDRRETSVCRFMSDVMTGCQPEIAGRNRVRFYWEECRLVPGYYSVNLHIRDSGVSLDKIVDAFAIEVQATDVYGTGRLDLDAGLIVPDGKWEFQQIVG